MNKIDNFLENATDWQILWSSFLIVIGGTASFLTICALIGDVIKYG